MSVCYECGIPASASTRRVVVVDDNMGAAKMLSMLVKAVGHDVQTAHDGPTGLQTVLDYRPDVVLSAIGLPGMNGHEIVQRIRKEPVLKNIVLVAMTGYGQDEDRRHSQEAGCDHHLVKPGDFKDVQAILAGCFREGVLTPADDAACPSIQYPVPEMQSPFDTLDRLDASVLRNNEPYRLLALLAHRKYGLVPKPPFVAWIFDASECIENGRTGGQ